MVVNTSGHVISRSIASVMYPVGVMYMLFVHLVSGSNHSAFGSVQTVRQWYMKSSCMLSL